MSSVGFELCCVVVNQIVHEKQRTTKLTLEKLICSQTKIIYLKQTFTLHDIKFQPLGTLRANILHTISRQRWNAIFESFQFRLIVYTGC